MIIVTGAGGFIASCLVARLNEEGYRDIVVADDFSRAEKALNLQNRQVSGRIHRDELLSWLDKNHRLVQFVYHLGARTDTAEFSYDVLNRLNVEYSKQVWLRCVKYGLPLVYASSAATYGLGEKGFDDDESLIPSLHPLNPYGESKNEFDKWVLQQAEKPYLWVGLKFFNVYGPNEYQKGRMASVVMHAFNQIRKTGKMKLFRSHNPQFADGEQSRDFIYVKDAVEVCRFWLDHRRGSGIYNLGSGVARTFHDLAVSTFIASGSPVNIEFIDTPEDIRDKYQYYTRASMEKIRRAGYDKPFHSLEEGVHDYVTRYLIPHKYW